MKRVKLLFLIILMCFGLAKKNFFRKKLNFFTQLETPKTVTFYYRVENGLSERTINWAYELLGRETCLIFEKISNLTFGNETIIRRGGNCSASTEIRDKIPYYYINVNDSCMNKEMIQRLTYLNINMKVQIEKCLSKIKHLKKEIPDKMLDLRNMYQCYIEHVDEAEEEYVNENLLQFSCLGFPKKKGVKPKDLKQKDYSNEISFKDVKYINHNMCENSCKLLPSLRCINGGYVNTKNCKACLCPFFYSGKFCPIYTRAKKAYLCGYSFLRVSSRSATKVLNLELECYYRIIPSVNKKIVVTFKANKPFYWRCNYFKFLEIKFLKDKTVDGVMPCGYITQFSITGITNSSVLVYHDKMGYDATITMKYKQIDG